MLFFKAKHNVPTLSETGIEVLKLPCAGYYFYVSVLDMYTGYIGPQKAPKRQRP